MKLTLLILSGFLISLSSFGQGTLSWVPPGSPIATNNLQGSSGSISGAGQYRFGLYIGSAGAPESSLTLVALTTNALAIGTFSGVNNVFTPFANGQQITFQVRAWSAFAGATYESALAYALGGGDPLAYLGQSPAGNFVIGSPGPLQSGTFVLTPVPEPSAVLLGVTGGLLILLVSRVRKRRQQ
jgi:hypothetical protein